MNNKHKKDIFTNISDRVKFSGCLQHHRVSGCGFMHSKRSVPVMISHCFRGNPTEGFLALRIRRDAQEVCGTFCSARPSGSSASSSPAGWSEELRGTVLQCSPRRARTGDSLTPSVKGTRDGRRRVIVNVIDRGHLKRETIRVL